MRPTVDELLAIATVMFDEGYTKSEAYPLKRWARNGWPQLTDPLAFKFMDAYLKMCHTRSEYERR